MVKVRCLGLARKFGVAELGCYFGGTGSFEGGAVGGVHALEEIACLVEKATGFAFGPELGDALEVVHHVGREDAVVLLRINAPAHAERGIRLWLRQIVIF